MPPVSGFGGLVENPLQVAGNAFSQMPNATAQQQQVGIQALQPYLQAYQRNPQLANDPQFMNRVKRIGKVYGVPIDQIIGGSGQPGGTATPGGGQVSTPGTGTSPGGTPTGQPGGQPNGQPGGQNRTTNPQPGATNQPGGATNQAPAMTQRQLMALSPYLNAAKRNPQVLNNRTFVAGAIKAAHQAGISPQQLKVLMAKTVQTRSPMGAGGQPGTVARPLGVAAPNRPGMPPGGGMPNGANTGANPQMLNRNPQNVNGNGQNVPGSGPNVNGGAGGGATPAGMTNGSNPTGTSGMDALAAFVGLKPTGLQPFGSVTLSPDQMNVIASSQPGQPRLAALEMAGIDPRTVPDNVINAKAYISPTEQITAASKAITSLTQLVKQGAGPQALQGAIAAYGAGDPDLAAALDNNTQIVQGLQQSSAAELHKLVESGIYTQAQADEKIAEITKANSVAELNEAHAGLFRVQASVLPMEAQAKVTAADAAASRASAYIADVNNRIQTSQFGTWGQQHTFMLGQARLLRSNYNQANTAYGTLLKTSLSAGVNPTKVTMQVPVTGPDGKPVIDPQTKQPQMKTVTLNDELIQAKQARDSAADLLRQMGDPLVSTGLVQTAINQNNTGSGIYSVNGQQNKKTVSIGGETYHVGDRVQDGQGRTYTVLANGKLQPQK